MLQDLISHLRFCEDLKLQPVNGDDPFWISHVSSLVIVYLIIAGVKGKTVASGFSETVVQHMCEALWPDAQRTPHTVTSRHSRE